MAKAAAIRVQDLGQEIVFPPDARSAASMLGDSLPSLGGLSGVGPGPSSLGATNPLSGRVAAVSQAKERAASTPPRKHNGGPPGVALPPTAQPSSAGVGDGQLNPRLPPLMHGYGLGPPAGPPSRGSQLIQPSQAQPQLMGVTLGTPNGGPGHRAPSPNGGAPPPQPSTLLMGPQPAAYPYQPKRKPPSAFMRNNPMKQQLDYSAAQRRSASARAASSAYDLASAEAALLAQLGPGAGSALGDESVASAAAAIAAAQAWPPGGEASAASAGSGSQVYAAAPPWGVSSVSDLEALDNILDQLVVVDARMRKALLKGPLISFETVVPEHAIPGRAAPQRRPGEVDEKDKTFLTSVKGITEETAAEMEEEGVEQAPQPEMPPLDLAAHDAVLAAAVEEASAAGEAPPTARISWAEGEGGDPRDHAIFRALFPQNTAMHPTFTRAYLSSKLSTKAQLQPPPPPATAEHLLRSRPPPFIAAPSYDQLCNQIRDVQKQYTCGSIRPPGVPAPAATGATTNQYIAGLDGPTLDQVVQQQDLPISLERVRPTFVALSKQKLRAASPRRRGGHHGREGAGGGGGGGGLEEAEGLDGQGL